MNEKGKVSFIYSWPVIILTLFIFWPVSIFLIIKRTSFDKKFALSVGKLLGIAGICSFVIAAMGLFVCVTEGFGSDDVAMIIFFVVAGLVLRKLAKKIKGEADAVKQYLAIIVNGNVRQLDSIAATTGKSYDVVRNDIQKMIKKGYLKNAYIDEGAREIVLPNSKPTVSETAATPMKNLETKTVTCSCCGANNTIVGMSGECEYCGNILE